MYEEIEEFKDPINQLKIIIGKLEKINVENKNEITTQVN